MDLRTLESSEDIDLVRENTHYAVTQYIAFVCYSISVTCYSHVLLQRAAKYE